MKTLKITTGLALILALAGSATAQEGKKAGGEFLAPPGQVVAIKAGKLYEPNSGTFLANQVILIHGDRITDVGANLAVPAGAKVIDLSTSTVMPGMIDAHIHSNDGVAGETAAQRALISLSAVQHDLNAGFTTELDMDDRGGFDTVDLRDMIDAGIVAGPRMQVAGQSLNFRGGNYIRDPGTSGQYYDGHAQDKDVNSPWLARAAVRELHNHGVDFVKVYDTDDFVGQHYMWRNGKAQVFYSLSTEEVQAIVDEAHRLGLKVACHDYGGDANDPCLQAGVDAPQHLEQIDDAGIKLLKAKHPWPVIFTPTIDDILRLEKGDLALSGNGASRMTLLETATKKIKAAGVEIAFGSGVTGADSVPHGSQANQFPIFVKWGFTPVEALRTTYIAAPKDLNYNMEREVGTVEKGKYADIIAVNGNPLQDITEMARVKFVMKAGVVFRDDRSGISVLTGAHD